MAFKPNQNRKPFKLFEEEAEKSFFARVVIPTISIFFIFLAVRLAMLESGITFGKIPFIDRYLGKFLGILKDLT